MYISDIHNIRIFSKARDCMQRTVNWAISSAQSRDSNFHNSVVKIHCRINIKEDYLLFVKKNKTTQKQMLDLWPYWRKFIFPVFRQTQTLSPLNTFCCFETRPTFRIPQRNDANFFRLLSSKPHLSSTFPPNKDCLNYLNTSVVPSVINFLVLFL